MDIQNKSTLTDEKLKIKFSSLKLTRPPDEFVSFDTRPKDFIVVFDDLTTANMDPCLTDARTAKLKFIKSCVGTCTVYIMYSVLLLFYPWFKYRFALFFK